jgi:hypothetical protein
MKRVMRYVYLASLCLLAVSMQAQNLSTYDAFNAKVINPDKWLAGGMCFGNGYDCVREVREGQLRLATRAYGWRDSDIGSDFSGSGLSFPFPDKINTLEIRFKVKSFNGAGCDTNTDLAHSQQLLFGSFFNSGSGDPSDDVFAYFAVEGNVPGTSLFVHGFMFSQNQFFNDVDLGTLEIGEPATATLRWDRANKTFVVRVVKTRTVPSVVEQTMPYSQADDQPPTQRFKSLQVGTFTPSCTTARSFTAMESAIDNVRVNRSALQ